ncbi:MAG: signal peptidase II [Eubacterium sp.]
MKKKRIYKCIFCISLLILLVMLDQITKNMATLYLKGKEPYVIIKNVLEFYFLNGGNKGAAWGIFSGWTIYFIIITLIVSIIILVLIIRTDKLIYSNKISSDTKRKFSILQIFFISLMAGALGNLIDRIFLGAVVDFIYFKLINFPIFNVADIYVTCSAFAIITICIFYLKEDEFDLIFSLKKKKISHSQDEREVK